eukprot:1134481-Rhodomonas_salina.1
MSAESPTSSVGSQDPMEPPQNTKTATAPEPVLGTEPEATGLPFELQPMTEPAHEAGPAHEAEAAPEAEIAHEAAPAPAAETAQGPETDHVLGEEEAHEAAEEAGAEQRSAEDAFYTMAADLQRTLDEIEVERHVPAPISDRRGEMTPGRVVHFEPAAATPDRDRSKLGFRDGMRHFSMPVSPLTSTGAGVGMTPIATQRALSAVEIKIKLL